MPPPRPIDPGSQEIAPEQKPESQVELLESYYPELDGNAVAGPAGIGMAPSGSGSAVGGGGPLGGSPRNFDEQTMIAPHRLSGRDPSYSRAALEHDVEGVMLVGCHVGIDGKVRAC